MSNIRFIYLLLTFLLDYGVDLGIAKNGSGTLRIIGGNDANITDYPYQVSILIGGIHKCGGSIISQIHVLTAAHCTKWHQPEELAVRAGSSIRDSGGQVVEIHKVDVHPQFDEDTNDYDVSVLTLKSPLELGSGVSIIDMVPAKKRVVNGEEAVATGWGAISYDGVFPTQLQAVALRQISPKKCSRYYDGAISNRMFCAGYAKGGKDTCQGDSGGPLVADSVLIGITSWGDIICGAPNAPGVFSYLAFLRDYVDSIINSN